MIGTLNSWCTKEETGLFVFKYRVQFLSLGTHSTWDWMWGAVLKAVQCLALWDVDSIPVLYPLDAGSKYPNYDRYC